MKGGIFQTERVTISRWVMNECAFKENFVFLFSFEKEQNFHARKKDGGREVKMCLSFSRWTAVGWLGWMRGLRLRQRRHGTRERMMFLFSILTLLSLSIFFFFFSPFLFAVKQIRACSLLSGERKALAIESYQAGMAYNIVIKDTRE